MKKRVLLADDDEHSRTVLASIIAEFDAEVYEANRDDVAYQRYLELGPDLLVIDVLLPRQGGLAFLKKLRGTRGGKDVPVLVTSAVHGGADLRSEAVDRLGALEVLRKPFRLDNLRRRFSSLLAEAKAECEQVATSFSPTEILNRGSLVTVDVPVLLKDLAFHRTTGCLNLRAGKVKKVVFLQDGEITFALSNQLRETLGRYLLARGSIEEETYRAGLETMSREKKKLGEYLIETEAVDAQIIFDSIRQNVLEKVLDLFAWQTGDFLLTPYAEPPALLPGQPFDMNRVLWDGIRGRFPFERLTASLAPHLELTVEAERDIFDLAGDVPLEKGDLQFLRIMRRLRGKTLRALLAEVPGEGEARFLYYLILRGYLCLTRGDGPAAVGREMDRTDLERVRRGRRRLDTMVSRNYFQVLEVPLDATDEKVREAYLHKAKDVHPDMLGPKDPPDLLRIHEETFQIVQTAYEALKTEPRRRDYLRFIQQGIEEDLGASSRILEAETHFQEARVHWKRHAWDAAAEGYRKALELNPDEGEYALYLGIARMRQASTGGGQLLSEAEDLFVRAMGLMPSSPEPYYRLGRVAALKGETEKAASYYQKALSRSPNHLDSLREMRLIRARSDKKGGGPGSSQGRRENK